MFCVGDKIVHPMHGAGVIESIVDEKIGKDLVRFYVFRMPVSGLTLKIPTANSEMIGVRAVSSAETIGTTATARIWSASRAATCWRSQA